MTIPPLFKIFKLVNESITAATSSNNPNLKRKDWARELGYKVDQLAVPYQVHSKTVLWVDSPGNYTDCDGLITQSSDIVLTLQTADCVPIFIYDNETLTRGLVHAGWRGTVGGIVPNAVELMQNSDCKIKNIHVSLGPAICKNCYKVGEAVAGRFNERSKQKGERDQWFVNLHEEIRLQLLNYGLIESNIHTSDICTYEDKNYCSYRRDGDKAGRMYSFFGVKNGHH